MWVQSLGWEDPLEEEMATHSSILPGKSHGEKSLAGYSPWGHKDLHTTEHGQGGLACCDSWGRKELDTTERLN